MGFYYQKVKKQRFCDASDEHHWCTCNLYSLPFQCGQFISNYCDISKLSPPSIIKFGTGLAISLFAVLTEALSIICNDFMRKHNWPSLFFISFGTNSSDITEIACRYNIPLEKDARRTLENFKKALAPLSEIQSIPELGTESNIHIDILCYAGFFPSRTPEQKNETYEKRVAEAKSELSLSQRKELESGAIYSNRSRQTRFIM